MGIFGVEVEMISEETVIVVGAGASFDLGFPLGSGLQQNVFKILTEQNEFQRYFHAAIRKHIGDPASANAVLGSIDRKAHPLRFAASVDNFLDQEKHDKNFVDAAKMAIAYSICQAEASSHIAQRTRPVEIYEAAFGANYFLCPWLNLLIRGHQEDNVADSLAKLTFIVFNYDRSVERVFYSWLQMRFPSVADDLFKRVRIIHVYGSLGNYSPSDPGGFMQDKLFPIQNPHLDLPDFVSKIKIFTEQEDSNVSQNIALAVNAAKCIAFVGFGFEEQNMRFFRVNPVKRKAIYATTFGQSEANERAIKENLESRLNGTVQTKRGKGHELFNEFYHSIASVVRSLP